MGAVLIQSLPFLKLDATVAPDANDDAANTGGNGAFGVGSIWVDVTANKAYINVDASTGAAVWTETTQAGISDAFLLSIADLGTAADKMIYTTGVDVAAETAITSAGRAILDDADALAQRATLGVVIGTNVLAEQTVGIANDNLLEVDDTPSAAEYARFTAAGLEGRTEAEFKADFNLEIGTDVLAEQTIGTAAAKNTGTSGDAVPLLDQANTFSDVQTFGSVVADNYRSVTVSLDDDVATTFTFASASIGFVSVIDSTAAYTALIKFKAGTSPHTVLLLDDTTDWEVATGTLAGTTGTDTKLTLSTHTDDKMYIENRTGTTRSLRIIFYGNRTWTNP